MPPETAETSADPLGDIGALIEDYPPFDNQPARATAVAAALLSAVQQPDGEPELGAAMTEMIAGLEPTRAVPLLLRLAELGRTPIAEAARDALERFRLSDGEHRPLELIEAWLVQSPESDALALDLGRGSGIEARAFLLRDKGTDPGGLVTGCAGAPTTDEDLQEALPELEDATSPERVSAETAAQWIRAAYATTAESGEPIPADLSIALTVVSKPVLGDADALPPLEVDAIDAIYGDPDMSLAVDIAENEGAAYELIDHTLAEYEQFLRSRRWGSREIDLGSCMFVAQTMLDYKANYGEGLLGDWTVRDLDDFMLGWWPRKVTADPETETNAPIAVLRFLRFLDERESLSGNSPEQLADTVSDLLEPFIDACMDRSSWGPGKSILMKAAETGVDIHDRAALEAYLSQLAPRLPTAAARPNRSEQDTRRARRKSARNARRRNRR